MSAIKTWKLIAKSLEQSIPVMLLYVLESKGSSPGRQGFFMAVNTNEEMEGSIGGGIMEHKFVEMAKSNLKSLVVSREYGVRTQESEVRKQVHDKSAAKDQSGMICSGEQTILLYPVKERELGVIRNVISSLEENKNGTLTLSPQGIQFDFSIPEKEFEYSFQSETDWLYKEKTGHKNQLFIIGGGHCSLAFSRLMRPMDFYIRVYDERKDLKTMLENEAAHEKYFVNDYGVLKDMIPPGNNNYVVIMTFGYRTDDIALRALLEKDFKYLGLLGSKSKIEKMFEDYRGEGIKDELLQRIHTPIGLPINSQTPEEIAISIAAEIIGVKNGRTKSQEPRSK
ncbi:MAG TPA: XdhC family protein [Chitinophagaceae bacterium]|nr:XdhC family protein [Chitinophagaceae bacterium]